MTDERSTGRSTPPLDERQLDRARLAVMEALMSDNEADAFAAALSVVQGVLGCRFGLFGYVDERGDLACPSLTREVWKLCQIPDKSIVFRRAHWGGLWGAALRERRVQVGHGPIGLPAGHIALDDAVAAPVVRRDEALGLLMVANRSAPWDRAALDAVEQLAAAAAPALHARRRERSHATTAAQMGERLARSEQFLSAALSRTPVPVCLRRGDHVVWGNEALCALTGYDLATLVTLPWDVLMAEEGPSRPRAPAPEAPVETASTDAAERGGVAHRRSRVRRRDGEVVAVTLHRALLDPTKAREGTIFVILPSPRG